MRHGGEVCSLPTSRYRIVPCDETKWMYRKGLERWNAQHGLLQFIYYTGIYRHYYYFYTHFPPLIRVLKSTWGVSNYTSFIMKSGISPIIYIDRKFNVTWKYMKNLSKKSAQMIRIGLKTYWWFWAWYQHTYKPSIWCVICEWINTFYEYLVTFCPVSFLIESLFLFLHKPSMQHESISIAVSHKISRQDRNSK